MEKLNLLMPLNSDVATKQFSKTNNKWILEQNYQAGKFFKGFTIPINNITHFYSVLKEHQEYPIFMIHGEFIEGTNLKKFVRRKREDRKDGFKPTIKDREIKLLCLDIDGYKTKYKGLKAIKYFIKKELPPNFKKADYVYQFSSSYGLTTGDLKVHLFFWLKEPVFNIDIKEWIKRFNKEKDWGRIIDDSILTCTQPIYIQKRIITNGSIDPVKKFVGYVKRDGDLIWENLVFDKESGRVKGINTGRKNKYDLRAGVEAILSSENYHDELNKLALSLINKKVPYKTVIQMLQGAMNSAKKDISGERLETWKIRYDDIERSVMSAVEIVGNPSFEEVADWVKENPESVVIEGFADKVLNFNPLDLRNIVTVIDKKLEVGIRAINATIKLAKEQRDEEQQTILRELKSQERASKGISEIEINNENYGQVTTATSEILANSKKNPEVFIIGKSLSIVEISKPKTVRQVTNKGLLGEDYPNMPIIKDISYPVGVIRSRVEKDVVFLNENGLSVICPDSILNAIPKMYGINWKPLTGLVEHPYIDNNWEIKAKNGYDKKTGLYSVLHRKLKINLMEPLEAYRYLCDEVFAEFPFDSELDRAVAVGAMMTAVQRPFLSGDNGFPGFAMVSPKPSSGKTTLAQLISYSVYNRPCAATGWSDNEEELGKHMLAILREGHSCVLFDNIKKDTAIKSDELAKAMTSGTYSRRKLGENETEEVPSTVLWLFTGNNILFKGDFATRILPIRIVPDLERPETRSFRRKDIGQWAGDNRKKILSAILSIILVGKEIEKEGGDSISENSSRFKDWDKFVRLPLLKVSGHDMLDVFTRNDFDDDETLAKGELLRLLFEFFGDKSFKTKDILDLFGYNDKGSFNNDGKEVKEAIVESFGEKAAENTRTLGRFLLGMKDFIIGGYQLRRGEKDVGGVNWVVINKREE